MFERVFSESVIDEAIFWMGEVNQGDMIEEAVKLLAF
jgi:hypothetical protein